MMTKGKIYGCIACLLEELGLGKKNPALRLDLKE
jgi:hypothetical protein